MFVFLFFIFFCYFVPLGHALLPILFRISVSTATQHLRNRTKKHPMTRPCALFFRRTNRPTNQPNAMTSFSPMSMTPRLRLAAFHRPLSISHPPPTLAPVWLRPSSRRVHHDLPSAQAQFLRSAYTLPPIRPAHFLQSARTLPRTHHPHPGPRLRRFPAPRATSSIPTTHTGAPRRRPCLASLSPPHRTARRAAPPRRSRTQLSSMPPRARARTFFLNHLGTCARPVCPSVLTTVPPRHPAMFIPRC